MLSLTNNSNETVQASVEAPSLLKALSARLETLRLASCETEKKSDLQELFEQQKRDSENNVLVLHFSYIASIISYELNEAEREFDISRQSLYFKRLSTARKFLSLFNKIDHLLSLEELDAFFEAAYLALNCSGKLGGVVISVGLGRSLRNKITAGKLSKNDIQRAVSNPKKFFKKYSIEKYLDNLKAYEQEARKYSNEKTKGRSLFYHDALFHIDARLSIPFQAALLDDYLQRAFNGNANSVQTYSDQEIKELCGYIDFRYLHRVLFELEAYYVDADKHERENLNALSPNALKYKVAIEKLLPFVYQEQWLRLAKRTAYTVLTLGIALAINWSKWVSEWKMQFVKIDLPEQKPNPVAPETPAVAASTPALAESKEPSNVKQKKEKIGLFNQSGELRKIKTDDQHVYATKLQAKRFQFRNSTLGDVPESDTPLVALKGDSRLFQFWAKAMPKDLREDWLRKVLPIKPLPLSEPTSTKRSAP